MNNLVCQNLQFASTKWAKAYLIKYIYWISCRKVWVISSFFAVCHGYNVYSRLKLIKFNIDKSLHDFEKRMIIRQIIDGQKASIIL